MKREAQLIGVLVVAMAVAAGESTPGESTPGESTPDEAKPDAGLTSVGKAVYKSYCASCHGTEAKGDGPVADFLRIPPTDLTRVARENGGDYPLEEVVRVIDGRERVRAHGSDMPIWGDVFQRAEGGTGAEDVRQKIDGLAHYLWSIQAEGGS